MVPLGMLIRFLEEDAPAGDLTSELLVRGIRCRAVIVSKEKGVVAGVREALAIFSHLGVKCEAPVGDGDRVVEGTVLIELEGDAEAILLGERTVLNLMGRMSGIATMTSRLVERVAGVNPGCRIASTRKTAPGLRYFDKRAVETGGGIPHRSTLSDMILIKDNHLALVPLEEAVSKARRAGIYRLVEVEVRTPEEAVRAAKAGADIVMLDNMSPEEAERAVEQLKSARLRGKVRLEVSGGISEENIAAYAALDVDAISIGAITNSVRRFDMSLEVLGRV